MFDSCKYVVLKKDIDNGPEKIFIFDGSISHKDFTVAMRRSVRIPIVVSAGFVSERLACFGESESLGVHSRRERDTKLLHKLLNINNKTSECNEKLTKAYDWYKDFYKY